jgi:hypothetical protein
MNTSKIRMTAVATTALLAVGGLAACSAADATLEPAATQAVEEPADEAEAPADEESEEPAGEKEDAEEEPAAEVGTRENPAAIGQKVTFSEGDDKTWQVWLTKPDLNANAQVKKTNQFNDPAPKGQDYAMVTVNVKRLAEEAATPWVDLSVKFVTAAGTTHEAFDSMVVSPDPSFQDINEMYKDAKDAGKVVIAVPEKDIENGAWVISSGFGDNDTFFKATK